MYQANQHERDILKYWQENEVFEKSVNERPEDKQYVFYDGPPFATGLPHYGHMVGSIMKDAVPRFWTMQGHRVERKWGWDCHGLPIENLVEKKFNIENKSDIEKMGVDKFNAECRSMVLGYESEWKKIIPRIGRWVDMDNAYKTMDTPYMESIWWVFKQVWEKGLIYEGYKPVHICPRCETVLSKFEVNQGYEEVKDISVTAKFRVMDQGTLNMEDDDELYFLAWTTTPWTLPGNVLLAVGEDIEYSLFSIEGEEGVFIAASELLESVAKDKVIEVEKKVQGKDLVGMRYEPVFPFFKDHENAFKVVAADFVITEDGTGIVHIAPGFGEDDFHLGNELGVDPILHVSMDGQFIPEVAEPLAEQGYAVKNVPVKKKGDTMSVDIEIIKALAHSGKLFSKEKLTHSYPHCWRCDTPLLNFATTSWFVGVTQILDKLETSAKDINWVPEYIKEGRFGKGLASSPDWSISRSRYWGTPLPIWRSEDGDVIVVGSVEELESLTGQKVDDLHKEFVDQLTIEQNGKTYTRIPEVLDCWFESGSMPYAQFHYPFENKEKFEENFPAEYIAEGLDQTRLWFHKLHVVSNILFDSPAYKNVIVNGIVLAEDGKKMSKRLQNYPDPMELVEKYGADALRYYLLTSPVVKAESLNFSEQGVREVFNKVMNTLWNVVEFYNMYAETEMQEKQETHKHVLDRWIMARLADLHNKVTENMKQYDLVEASRPIMDFILDLSQWYVRRSRDRFKGLTSEEDKVAAVATLQEVLVTLSKVMAPFTPFVAEKVYQSVTGSEESVHLTMWPEPLDSDEAVLEDMEKARKVVEMGLSLRKEAGVKVRQPLQKFSIFNFECSEDYLDIISDELNVKEVVIEQVDETMMTKEDGGIKVALDTHVSEQLEKEGLVRAIVRAINMMRKDQQLTVDDNVVVTYQTDDALLAAAFEEFQEEIKKQTVAKEVKAGSGEAEQKIDGHECRLSVEIV